MKSSVITFPGSNCDIDVDVSLKKFGFKNQMIWHNDNELPKNTYTLEPFKISSFITNKEWKDFIDNGGYKNFRYWLSDGWDFIKKNKIDKPLYWLDQNNYFTLSGVKKIDNDAPVSHISYYEANAYANYKKSRLPNEFEIEYVLKNTSKKGNFLENNIYEQISYDNDFYLDSC